MTAAMKFYTQNSFGSKVCIRNSEDDSWIELFGKSDEHFLVEKTDEYPDLEDREYISADIEFDTNGADFDGLNPIDFKVKKKQEPKKIVEHVRHRESNRGLF